MIMLQIYAAQLAMTALAARHWAFRLLKAKTFLQGEEIKPRKMAFFKQGDSGITSSNCRHSEDTLEEPQAKRKKVSELTICNIAKLKKFLSYLHSPLANLRGIML